MGFPRQEYWSGLPFASPGDLPNPGIEPVSPALTGGFFITEPVIKEAQDREIDSYRVLERTREMEAEALEVGF